MHQANRIVVRTALSSSSLCLLLWWAVAVASGPRVDAAAYLAERGFDTSIEGLEILFLDADTELRSRQIAALALGQSHDSRASIALQSELDNSDVEIRAAALRGLAELADPDAIPAIRMKLMTDPNAGIRQVALSALSRTGGYAAYQAIAGGLQVANQDKTVKVSIIEVLRANPSFDSSNYLNDLLTDADSETRTRAAIALLEHGKLGSHKIIVDAITRYDIPHYLWADAVEKLGESSSFQTDEKGRRGHFRIDADEKRRIRDAVRSWWAATAQESAHKE